MPKTKIPAEYISDNPSLSGTDSVKVPAGTTAQRGTGVAGKFRFNTTLNKFEGYTDSWGEIGGSGGSALETDNFTGDDSTTAFTLSSSVSDEDNLIVFIDGVYQNKADYVASGTTLTLDTAPLAGRKIVVYHVRANVSGSNCILNSFSGNGSTTAFTLTQNPASENNTQVFIDGVYQRKSSYAVSGTTLTFDAAPGNGTAIEVMMFTQTDINTLPASFVSGLTEVTATGSDHLMVFDATDSSLKKALASDLIETVGATPSFTTATITNTTTNDSLLITSTEDSSSAAPVITLKRNSGSPADADYLGQLKFKGENDADQEVVYAKVTGKIDDASDGSEDGLLEFALRKAGSNNIGARLTSTDLKLINGTGLEVAGNVAVGTTSASVPMHIQDQASSDTTVLRLENKPATAATNAVAMEFWGNEGTANNGVYNIGKIYGHFDGSNYSDTRLTLGSAAGNGSFNDELTLKYGSVGISTANPNTQLHILKSSTNAHHDHIKLEMSGGWAGSQNQFKNIVWNDGTSNVGGIGMTYDGTTTNMHFHSMYNGGYKSETDEVFSILGSGKCGINDSSPTQALEVVDSNNYKGIHIRGSVAPCLTFAQGTNTTPSWRVGISGYAGDSYTIATGASVGDKIHIKPAGHFIVNGTANQANGSCTSQVASNGVTISNNATTGAGHGHEFQTFRRGGTQIGSIYMNGTTQTGYAGTSDYRLKENVNYTWDATENLKRLKPAKFNFIADTADLTIHGFIAHEVADIIPEAVSGDKDATETINNVVLDSDNNIIARDISEEDWTIGKNEDIYPSDSTWSETHDSPKYQQLDQSKLIPLLVKTIQELEARIETLENA